MTSRMTWPDLCRSERYKGLWVAIDNCRYDSSTRQPVEGDVVDSDEELSELCARMLRKDPAARPADAGAVLGELLGFGATDAAGSRPTRGELTAA